MEIKTTEKYILFKAEDDFQSSLNAFNKIYTQHTDHNIVIDCLAIESTTEELNQLYTIASNHIKNGVSFVVIAKNIDVDDFEEDFNIVPTLIEAEDIIDMDEMTRDLGF